MKFKTLYINENSEENITCDRICFPVSVSIEKFDDYLNGEWGIHWHNEYEFGFLLSGDIQFTFQQGGEKTYLLHKGDGFFVNSGVLHYVKAIKKETQLVSVVFKPSIWGLLPVSNPVLLTNSISLPLYPVNTADEKLLAVIHKFGYTDNTKDDYDLAYIEFVCRLWRELRHRMESMPDTKSMSIKDKLTGERIKQILLYIQKHYAESITSEDMAKGVNISRTECFRLFKNYLKRTPTEYLTEYRFSKAVGILTSSGKTLTDVALSCGFSNPSYFCKQFKRHFGTTPNEFRKKQ